MPATDAQDFERGILGCVLVDNGIWPAVESVLRADHFGLDSHQRIFAAMRSLFSAGRSIDSMTLADELGGVQKCEAIGGWAYIDSLTEGMYRFPESRVRTYADKIREAWKAREMLALGEEMALRAADEGADGLSDYQTRLEAILSDCGEGDEEPAGSDGALERWEEERKLERSPALPFGVSGLDSATGGMFPGHQIVIGARSGVGKTRLLIQATAAACMAGHSAQMNLIEPTKDEFIRGLATFYSGVRADVAVQPWTADNSEAEKFRAAMAVVREWRSSKLLSLYGRANMSLDEIIGRGRVAIHHGCRLIGVDYLQRVYVPSSERGEQMRLKVARASTALANLVKDTQCTSLVLSQLKRTETMGIPTMQDLRESGQIENDAHLIVLLHRDYDSEKGIFQSSGAYVVPKRRFGPPANRRAHFNPLDATWEDAQTQSADHWNRED